MPNKLKLIIRVQRFDEEEESIANNFIIALQIGPAPNPPLVSQFRCSQATVEFFLRLLRPPCAELASTLLDIREAIERGEDEFDFDLNEERLAALQSRLMAEGRVEIHGWD